MRTLLPLAPLRHSLASLAAVAFASTRGLADPIEPVRALSAPLERGGQDPDAASSTVRGQRLRAPGTTASDLLRSETGVTVNESGGYGALSTVQIRGSSSAQVPVYLAGIRLNDDLTGAADLSLVPTWLLARAEIYRGAAPFAADPWGLGGAVFFEPMQPKGTHAALGLMRGSFGARGAWLRASAGSARAGALFGVRLEGARNTYTYEDNAGTLFQGEDDRERTRENAAMQGIDAWSVARVHTSRAATLDLLVQGLSRAQGVPGLALVPNLRASLRTERALIGLRARVLCGEHCLVSSHTATIRTHSVFSDPRYELALLSTTAEALSERTETGSRVEYTDRWQLSASARFAREQIHVRSGTTLDGERLSGRFAALLGRAFGESHVRAMVAADTLSTSSSNSEGRGALLPSARISAQVVHSAFAVRANLGSYVRIPTLGELYGIASAVRGNAALREESGIAGDLGIDSQPVKLSRRVSFSASATAFARASRDLVAFERSSLGYVVPYNVGAARTVGAEIDLAGTFAQRVHLRWGATLLSATDASEKSGRVIPFQSRLITQPRIEVDVPSLPILGVDRGLISVGYTYQSNRYADAAGIGLVPAQGSMTAALELGLGVMHLALRGTNLLNEKRFDMVGYPLPGPAVYFSTEAAL